MPGPFRLRPGPAGDLATYASATPPGAPVRGHVVLCPRPAPPQGRGGRRRPDLPGPGRPADPRVGLARRHRPRCAAPATRQATSPRWAGWTTWPSWPTSEIPESAPRLVVGFGFGGVLALHLAAGDERVAGVACLGTPGRPGPAGRATPSGCWRAAARPA